MSKIEKINDIYFSKYPQLQNNKKKQEELNNIIFIHNQIKKLQPQNKALKKQIFNCENNYLDIPQNIPVRPYAWVLENKSKKNTIVYSLGISRALDDGGTNLIKNTLLDFIKHTKDLTTREKAFYVYLHCRRNECHGPQPSKDWNDEGLRDFDNFYRSYGYGLCGNRAIMFKEICEILGIKSRVWNIMGLHTFSEIFVSGKWMILDPDLATWHINDKKMNEIISFSKLRKKNSDYWKNLHMHDLYANNFRDEFTELFAKSPFRQVKLRKKNHKIAIVKPKLELLPGEKGIFYFDKRPDFVTEPIALYEPSNFLIPRNLRLLEFHSKIESLRIEKNIPKKLINVSNNSWFKISLKKIWPIHDTTLNFTNKKIKSPLIFLQYGKKILGPFKKLDKKRAKVDYRLRKGIIDMFRNENKKNKLNNSLIEDSKQLNLWLSFKSKKLEEFELVTSHQYSISRFLYPRNGKNKLEILSDEKNISLNYINIQSKEKFLMRNALINKISIERTPENLTISWSTKKNITNVFNNFYELNQKADYEGYTVENSRYINWEIVIFKIDNPIEPIFPECHSYTLDQIFVFQNINKLKFMNKKNYKCKIRMVTRDKLPISKWFTSKKF